MLFLMHALPDLGSGVRNNIDLNCQAHRAMLIAAAWPMQGGQDVTYWAVLPQKVAP